MINLLIEHVTIPMIPTKDKLLWKPSNSGNAHSRKLFYSRLQVVNKFHSPRRFGLLIYLHPNLCFLGDLCMINYPWITSFKKEGAALPLFVVFVTVKVKKNTRRGVELWFLFLLLKLKSLFRT